MSTPYSGAATTQAPPEPIFIGLDLSLTSTGIAVAQRDTVKVSRVTSKPTTQDTSAQASRLLRIVGEILDHIPSTEHTHVAIEGPAFGANDRGAHIRGGLWWLVRTALDTEGIDTVIVPPASVKKFATGSGNAKKDAVLAAVIRRYPDVAVDGNDEADALVLAAIVARLHDHALETHLPQQNLAAIRGVGR